MSFPESKYSFYFEKAYFKKVLSFTGWTLYGRLSDMAKTHAITLLLNQMFNPAVVAARAIATNVSTQVQAFSGNFTSSMNPAIIKLYSAGEMDELYRLIYRGAKISFFLMWVMALPLIVEMPLVLKLWLKNPPPDAAIFARLVLVDALIFAISNPVATAARGPGKIKKYELVLGTFQIMIFFISLVVVYLGYPAYSVYVVAIVTSLIMLFIRLYLVRELIQLNVANFFRLAVVPSIGVVAISSLVTYLVSLITNDSIISAGFLTFTSVVVSCVAMFFIGLSKGEQKKISDFLRRKLTRNK